MNPNIVKEKIGPFDVLTANSLLAEVGKPIEISLGNAPEALSFIFNMINDPNKDKYSSEARLIGEKKIELNLFNFIADNVGGGGTTHPVQVGHFQNRRLYYSFYVNSVGGGVQPLFSYTFYLGEEVKDE